MFVFIGLILLLIILLLFYVTILSFRKLSIFNNKRKLLSWCLSLIPLFVLLCVFNYVNAIVIIFYYVIFLLIINLIMILFKKKNNDLLVIITIIITAIYFGYATYQCHHVYETKYIINTSKVSEKLRVIQISDTHVGNTFNGKEFAEYIKKMNEIEPDLLVITGDFIDDGTSYNDMVDACSAFSLINPKYGIYFINGNHDRGYINRKYTYEDLLRELNNNNVKVLTDEVVDINDSVVLVGRDDAQYNRKSISDLVSNIDKNKFIIDLNHQPTDYENEKGVVDLVLSGHTHGGQLFPFGPIIVLIGANDEYYGLHKRGDTNFIVSSGMSCWETDFKTGTKSEYVVIDINGEAYE